MIECLEKILYITSNDPIKVAHGPSTKTQSMLKQSTALQCKSALTVRIEDACILDFIRKAGVYFIGRSRLYRWASPFYMEVTENEDHREKKEKKHPLPDAGGADHRA